MASRTLRGKKILITAGPTHEALDPVRYLGNRSTGKMGIALAEEAHRMGAKVILVLGPTHIRPDHPEIDLICVETAQQMFDECVNIFPSVDIAIMAAAVADYRPKTVSSQKIKKNDSELTIELERTQDILQSLGTAKKPGQFLVGFALETHNEIANAKAKLKRKNADMIVLNSLQDEGAGFGVDTNRINLIFNNGNIIRFELTSKQKAANNILENVAAAF